LNTRARGYWRPVAEDEWSVTTPIQMLVLGRPGSGKGTQGALVAARLGIAHISTGDLLRAEVGAGTALGRDVARFVEEGRLVPDPLVLEALCSALHVHERRERGFVLDGFPRSIAQAIALERAIAPTRITCALELLVPEREAAHRLLARFVCVDCGQSPHHAPGASPLVTIAPCEHCGGVLRRRPDDQVASILRRFGEFEEHTKPLLEWLDQRGLLVSVDAARPAGDVLATLLEAVEQFTGADATAQSA
jgi:adenylate kinase